MTFSSPSFAKLYFGVFTFLVLLVHFSMSGDLPAKHLCKRVGRPDFQSSLSGVVRLVDRLLLIDFIGTDYLLYDVPASSIINPDQVDISEVLPKKIEDYWDSFNDGKGEWKTHVMFDYKMFYPVTSTDASGQAYHYLNIDSVYNNSDDVIKETNFCNYH